jgi:hypothetical protein
VENSAAGELTPEEGEVVDELKAVLVDPSLHTDMRMRLQQEVRDLLRATHEEAHGPAGAAAHESALAAHGEHLPDLVSAVLTDPNVHSELRMRICREIPELVSAARDTPRTAPPGD